MTRTMTKKASREAAGSLFGTDLIEGMKNVLAYVEGDTSVGVLHTYPSPREVRTKAGLTQEQMAPLLGLSVSGYRKIEQGQRSVQGPAAVLLRVLDREPEAVKRALFAAE